jgi:hypothetical protein
MIYHSTARDRFVYLLILALCVGLVAATAFFFVTRTGAVHAQAGQGLGVTAFLLAAAAWLNWTAWNSTVRVGDQGVEWKDGNKTSSLAWENIAGLGWKTERKYLKVGLVEKSTRELRVLPFLSEPLYETLKVRCGRLPAETEKILGFLS